MRKIESFANRFRVIVPSARAIGRPTAFFAAHEQPTRIGQFRRISTTIVAVKELEPNLSKQRRLPIAFKSHRKLPSGPQAEALVHAIGTVSSAVADGRHRDHLSTPRLAEKKWSEIITAEWTRKEPLKLTQDRYSGRLTSLRPGNRNFRPGRRGSQSNRRRPIPAGCTAP